nr:hypothetical protein [Comamonas jiangduensis]
MICFIVMIGLVKESSRIERGLQGQNCEGDGSGAYPPKRCGCDGFEHSGTSRNKKTASVGGGWLVQGA